MLLTSNPSTQRSRTMLMQRGDAEIPANATVQKLRFDNPTDFWAFVAQIAASRVHAYASHWN